MPVNTVAKQIRVVLFLVLMIGTLSSCGPSTANQPPPPGVHTWLLVKAPEDPLPVDKPVNVRSRTEDGAAHVSHVELHALQLPSGEENVLIRSDRAPFDQSSFTVSQIFVPKQPGHYVVQVVGYNRKGETSQSNILGFDVE